MVDVFIVFAPEDRELLIELEKHLHPLMVEELITVWHESKIRGGTDVEQEISKHWNVSSVIILLISANFMATSACYRRGKEALEKSKRQKEVRVVPVLLKEVDWEHSDFGKLMPLPTNSKAIASWKNRDAAYLEVARGIRDIIAQPQWSAETNTVLSSTSVISNREKETSMSPNIENKLFDVFICYNSKDEIEVKEIAKQLKDRGVKPWLDKWELRPGLSWQKALEKQIENIHAVAVFVGKEGIGPWQEMEMNAYLRKFVRLGSPVIPVLLKDAPQEPSLPVFLEEVQYIDFRNFGLDIAIDQLIWGITGYNPADNDQDKSRSNSGEVASTNGVAQKNGGGNSSEEPGERKLSAEEMRQLVELLLACPIMGDRHSRDAVVQELDVKILQVIPRSPIDKVDVMNIAKTCLYFSGGLQALVAAVAFYEGDSLPMQRLRAFVQGLCQ